ncbi:SNF1-related protein kinase regulatory subunit beta-2 [Porphyridium purpureum]|uniref:SNF1-related protein kinase regulatory subunit beta-2 n=1 Tax=Porphyridium purpureum TaxID=35688 RepID=A0A5J4Z6T7_PORPP|nr:SNF1-related protein kinase regulatory subunit beta-2 [Porphyridium purpureum]|eukprot:POR0162..scf295_1
MGLVSSRDQLGAASTGRLPRGVPAPTEKDGLTNTAMVAAGGYEQAGSGRLSVSPGIFPGDSLGVPSSSWVTGPSSSMGPSLDLQENSINMLLQTHPSLGNIVPTVFTWSHGGNQVFVTGAWDHWQSKAQMHRAGNEYMVILSLQCGRFQYKFIVDGEWRHCASQPTERDEHGNVNNMVEVRPHVSEFDLPDIQTGLRRPPSPIESYDFSMPAPEEYAIDPPQLPPHYHSVVLNQSASSVAAQQKNMHATAVVRSPASGVDLAFIQNSGELPPDASTCEVPNHVSIRHLYTASKTHAEEEVQVVGITRRYRDKFITMVLYTHPNKIEEFY